MRKSFVIHSSLLTTSYIKSTGEEARPSFVPKSFGDVNQVSAGLEQLGFWPFKYNYLHKSYKEYRRLNSSRIAL